MPHAKHYGNELAEISNTLMLGAETENSGVTSVALRQWYKRFNGDAEMWDAEYENA